MPGPKTPPKYRHHKSTGRAVVTIDGRDVYLGPYGSPESHRKYNALIDQWTRDEQKRGSGRGAGVGLTVGQLCLRYLEHAQGYYRRADGTMTEEVGIMRMPMLCLVMPT